MLSSHLLCKSVFKTRTSHHNKLLRSASKPNEKIRSASSTTRTSREACRSRLCALMWASTRDGVPTTTSGFSIRMGLSTDEIRWNHKPLSRVCKVLRSRARKVLQSWARLPPLRGNVRLAGDVGHSDVSGAEGRQLPHHGLDLLAQLFGRNQDQRPDRLLPDALKEERRRRGEESARKPSKWRFTFFCLSFPFSPVWRSGCAG